MSFRAGDILIVLAPEAPGGKTRALGPLVAELRAQGLKPVALKPVETGCEISERHEITSRDLPALDALSEHRVPHPVLVPYRLRARGTARDAARAAGLELRLADLASTLEEASAYGDVLVVEAAGPAMAPVAEDGTWFDLAERVQAKVVLVPPEGAPGAV